MTSIDHALLAQLKDNQRESGELTPAEIKGIIHEVLDTLEQGLTVRDLSFYAELEKLHDFIENAKEEIRAIRPDTIQEEHIPIANDELSAVVRATEEATSRILDAAEMIEGVADTMEGDAKDRLQEAATVIYEASNFQDITGQRITKVINALHQIDEKIASLLTTFDPQRQPKAPATPVSEEKSLLNGPQLPENAQNQDDIDALFDSL